MGQRWERRNKAWAAVAAGGVLAVTAALAPTTAAGQQAAAPGDPELHNLEHVFNFDTQAHDTLDDPNAHRGTDLEFVTIKGRDYAVMGSSGRGAYIFDVTDPENPAFVTQVTCRQDRNDVGIKKFADPRTGRARVVLALTQQSGTPCPDEETGVGLRIDEPMDLTGFHSGVQWGDTGDVAQQTGRLVYAGTGCSLASYAEVAGEIRGNIALVDQFESQTNPADQCPTFTFFQKVRSAQEAGAVGFIQIPAEGEEPSTNTTAIAADIPAIELFRTEEAVEFRDAVIAGTDVTATIDNLPGKIPLIGKGSGGLGLFDITQPRAPKPMYRLLTGLGGVHNFAFHPTAPYGYVSNGALPGGINEIPIVDFSILDSPKVLRGPDTEGGVHDVELNLDGTRAYAASENNYRIYDVTTPWRPKLVSRTPNVGSYAHGVFPSPDGQLMVTNNESLVLGGFFVGGTGVCPGEGLASYDISAEETPVGPLGYYVPHVVGPTDERPCTSHFGRFAPGTRVMSIGWYIAGTRIVDWSDPSNPTEVAGAVLEGTNTWAAKFHKGPYVYAGDIGRGFDVFRWTGDGPAPWVAD
ncbi:MULTISPECIES: PA domain-containing protein [Nocardioides]|uniref:PA domain-containing protein n=1 Tax=Nocardioides vastitatis TaxID=2568655 RepID=A0ABW0ZFE6_9ACTN|nr:PA domain-containing protein [Nocardioides sp.]THI95724.1 hypothetical protein E7Z54_18280 [Nocardioides sp.]